MPRFPHVSSAAVRLVVGAGQAGLPPCTGLFWNLLYTLNYVVHISLWTFCWTIILNINRLSPVLVVTNLIYVLHISDGTSCWTVILINDRVSILLWNLSENVGLYIYCRPLMGRLFFMPHIIWVFPSDQWQECLSLYFYGPVISFRQVACVIFVQYFSLSHICYSWGRGFWPVIRREVPLSV